MIRHIKGKYIYYDKGAIVVETLSGISFRIFVPTTSSLINSAENDDISVYTYMHVKDDGISLYGFPERESLTLFEQLIGVNGVGPKAALSIMSIGSSANIKAYIANKDSAAISTAQGIGKKTAERIILELSDKVNADMMLPGSPDDLSGAGMTAIGERSEAINALVALGYSRSEAEGAVAQVSDEELSAEEYIKKSLRCLI